MSSEIAGENTDSLKYALGAAGPERWEACRKLKLLLGGPSGFLPFAFHLQDGSSFYAHGSGLEGFVFSLREISELKGRSALFPLLTYFFSYLHSLFESAGSDYSGLQSIESDWANSLENSDPGRIFQRLFQQLEHITSSAQERLIRLDPAQWIRDASIYQIYIRAHNLPGLREIQNRKKYNGAGPIFEVFSADDLPAPFSAIRWTGTYPIGEEEKKGIGSPFAIRDHKEIAAELGSRQSTKEKLAELARAGVRTIFELSPNHTSVDSELLTTDPQVFIHKTSKPENLDGYFEYYHKQTDRTFWIRRGGYMYDAERFYWNDTLQLDHSNPKTRSVIIEIIKSLVKDLGVHGFRVDMAYQLLNRGFKRTWGDEVGESGERIEDEFFFQVISAVKSEYPWVAFIAEGFHSWDRLSETGFDLVYSKNDMALPGNFYHVGWYNSLVDRQAYKLRDAIKRASFLSWQKGAAGMLAFIGHHDLPSPKDVFNEWLWGATALTLLLPVARNWYAGTEALFSKPCNENGKMITFAEHVLIDWSGITEPFADFVTDCITLSAELQRSGKAPTLVPLSPESPSASWAGYALKPSSESGADKTILVLANTSENPQRVILKLPELGIPHFECNLGPCGKTGVAVILYEAQKYRSVIAA